MQYDRECLVVPWQVASATVVEVEGSPIGVRRIKNKVKALKILLQHSRMFLASLCTSKSNPLLKYTSRANECEKSSMSAVLVRNLSEQK